MLPAQAEEKSLSNIVKLRRSPKSARVAIKGERRAVQSVLGEFPEADERYENNDGVLPTQESSLEQVFHQGFRQGQQETETRMRAEFEQIFADEQKRVAAFISSLEEQQKTYHQSLEQSAMRFGLAVAEIIVKREVSIDKELVLQQVREALKRVVGVERIKLRVNPQDEAIVKGNRSVVTEDSDSVRDIMIEIDETIEPGGCILESDSGNVDARLSTQLKKIEESLFEATSR